MPTMVTAGLGAPTGYDTTGRGVGGGAKTEREAFSLEGEVGFPETQLQAVRVTSWLLGRLPPAIFPRGGHPGKCFLSWGGEVHLAPPCRLLLKWDSDEPTAVFSHHSPCRTLTSPAGPPSAGW